MEERRINAMAQNITAADDDTALVQVDRAIDNILAGLITLDENLPNVETEGVPQEAALDEVTNLLNEAVKPYMADVVKVMQVFGE